MISYSRDQDHQPFRPNYLHVMLIINISHSTSEKNLQTAPGHPDVQVSNPHHSGTVEVEEDASIYNQEHHGEEQEGDIDQAVQSSVTKLGVDLPGRVIESMTVTYHGMTPMERFVKEKLGLDLDEIDVQNPEGASSCDATVGSSEETVVDTAAKEAEG